MILHNSKKDLLDVMIPEGVLSYDFYCFTIIVIIPLDEFSTAFCCCCWVFVAACGLFSSCGEQGLLFVAVRGLLIAVASLVAEHGL